MNNDIKEILDILEKRKNWYLHQQKDINAFVDEDYIAYMVLDYITNLQQAFENSYTKEELDFAVNEVKEQLKAEHQLTNQLHNEIDKLRIKNYELQQENERLKEKEDYKSRVEKSS